MGRIQHRISLRDVAAEAGVHVSTASLALRDDRRLTEATRQRVRAAAERVGYRANPLVSAWLRQVRRPEAATSGAGLGFLLGLRASEGVAREPYYRTFLRGAREEAEALGYTVSETVFGPDNDEALLKAISRFRYCGVRGVLLFDPARCMSQRVADALADGFAVVVLLRAGHGARFHRVGVDIGANVSLALQELRAAGCRRIGFPVAPQVLDAVREEALAAYLLQQQFWPRRERVPLPAEPVDHSRTEFLSWASTHRPDAILSVNIELHGFLAGSRRKSHSGIVYAHIGVDARPGLTGVLNRGADVGREAVFKLAGMVTGNRVHVPEVPVVTLVPGIWRPAGFG